MVPNLVYRILTILFFILQRGTWSDSETERLLRAILKYAKSYIYDKGKYRVVKRNCQVVSFHNFGHISARMAQNFDITSKLNIFQLIQSKILRLKA